ncbi:TPA: hypothetical protein EYP66_15520 [Candidatus Poribacteria bacterium]|nr:hypothetical protein [Candidatus Poribacteria bacterium]
MMKSKIVLAFCLVGVVLIIGLSSSLSGQEGKQPIVSEVGAYRITTNIPYDYDLLPTYYKEHKREARLRVERGEAIDQSKPYCLPQCHTFEQIGEIKPIKAMKPEVTQKPAEEKSPVESILISLMMLGYFFAPLY